MRIAVCDDDKQEQQATVDAIRSWDTSRNPECFFSGKEMLEAALRLPHFSIVFMDIYLPKENGIDIAKELMRISPETEIVFITTSEEHAVEAFSIQALHYLVKPVKTEDIKEAFYRLSRKNAVREKALSVTIGRNVKRIYLKDIYVVQSVNHATEILMSDGSDVKVWSSLEEISSQLNDDFLKIQRGIIVNMEYIEQMGMDSCVLRDGTKLLLSRKEKASIRDRYSEFAFENIIGSKEL